MHVLNERNKKWKCILIDFCSIYLASMFALMVILYPLISCFLEQWYYFVPTGMERQLISSLYFLQIYYGKTNASNNECVTLHWTSFMTETNSLKYLIMTFTWRFGWYRLTFNWTQTHKLRFYSFFFVDWIDG